MQKKVNYDRENMGRCKTREWSEVCPSGHQESADHHICLAGDQGEDQIPGKGKQYPYWQSH